jgi:hypothetical protein
MRTTRSPAAVATLVAIVIGGAASPALGAGDEQAPRPAAPPTRASSPDFYFQPPVGSLGVRGSWVFARAGSDIFRFFTNQLTLDKGDFSGPGLAADLGFAITPRLDVVAGVDYARSAASSEYRDLVDNNRLAIEQRTELTTVGLTGSLRYALVPRVHPVGRLAWVPRRVVPYVGAGGGLSWYKLLQSGDFVDYVDLSVFPDVFLSKGWTPTVHGFGGVDLQLHRRLFATMEGRYAWASTELDTDFVNFEPIDLAGFRMSAGISFAF